MSSFQRFPALCGAAVILCSSLAPGQTPAATATPEGAKPPRQGGFAGPRQPSPDDNTGFIQIFDGKSLANWNGDSTYWRVDEGSITGETTAEKPLKVNTFIVWQGGRTKDFELKLEFRMFGGNSGVQYRSVALTDVGPYVLKGYQADMDAKQMYTGMLYEERGRGFLAERGRVTRIVDGGGRKLVGSPGDSDALRAMIKSEDWNQLHIIARGNTIMHLINGRVVSICLDDDEKGRIPEGLLGLQLHVGPPMKVQFRNIYLRKL